MHATGKLEKIGTTVIRKGWNYKDFCYTSVFLKATALLLSYSPGKEAYVFPRLPIFAE